MKKIMQREFKDQIIMTDGLIALMKNLNATKEIKSKEIEKTLESLTSIKECVSNIGVEVGDTKIFPDFGFKNKSKEFESLKEELLANYYSKTQEEWDAGLVNYEEKLFWIVEKIEEDIRSMNFFINAIEHRIENKSIRLKNYCSELSKHLSELNLWVESEFEKQNN